jgi:2-aminoadipate transaminase
MQKFIDAATEVINKEGAIALQYGPSEGHKGLIKQIQKIVKKEGINVDSENILVTSGSQQALDIIGKILIDPGDKIIVEAPSYVGALNAFVSYQADFVPIPLDNDGIRINSLANTLRELKKQNKPPKFIYLVPDFHNPAGITMSEEKRKKIISLAKEYKTLIIEDNPYSQLRFEGTTILPIRSLDNSVVYLGTFSKIFSPGLRLGWIIAPSSIYEKLIFAKQAADLCTSSFAQRVVEVFFKDGLWKNYLKDLIDCYREKRDVMLGALEEFFPKEAEWTKPEGGLFVWVKLPEYINTTQMLAEAVREKKVAYVPGKAFFADGKGTNCMRLNFSYPEKDEIYEGIKRLSVVVKKQMELYKSFNL